MNIKAFFENFLSWFLGAAITACVYFMWDISKGVGEMNIKLAVVITNQANDSKRVDDHEERIRKLEKN